MPPRASTSKLSGESTPGTASRSPSVSARGSIIIKSGSNSTAATIMEDGGDHSSNEDELDEDPTPARKNGKATSSRASKPRSSVSAATSVLAGGSPLEDHHMTSYNDDSNSTNGNTQSKNIAESTSGLTKEELALADRRRRNRETQRAIRKKKANRLQEAETKVSLFEIELENLRLKNRDLENELFVLKRELDDWRSGRIHANPSIIAVNNASGSTIGATAGPSTVRRSLNHIEDLSEELSKAHARAALPYQTYAASAEERKVLGKRRQTFDEAHYQGAPMSRHYIHPIQADSPRSRPVYHDGGSPSSTVASARIHSPSVLQPIPVVPRSLYPEDMEYTSAQRGSSNNVHHPTALDTASNEEGSYGGSDPSPSSAGTVVPSYTSAFNATTGGEALPSNAASNLISEAVQAVRAQEVALPAGAIPRDTQPRSQSLQSTTTSISDRPSSYDDYHEFWTSASNSQSQSDSLTSMSSYRSSAVGGHRYSSSHLSGAALPGAIQGGGLTTAGADGMILSMSRSSLCASPLSIAEEREEAAYQGTSRGRTAPKDEDIAQSTDSSRQGQHKHLKPSLPSLSSSLKEDRYNPASLIQLSPDRTASLPLPTPHMSASPPQPPYLPSSWRQYPHRQIHRSEQLGPQASQGHTHSRSPDSHPHTLPPIASVLQSHEATLPAPSHPDLFPPAKKQFLTRNGRGKTTSYPIFEVPREVNNDRSSADSGASFQWPSSAPTAPRTSIADTSSYDGSSVLPLPLPRRAATRAPLSSTRDDSDDTAMSTSATEEKDQAEHLHQQAEEKTSQLGKEIVMSPSDYNDEGDGLTESAISREGAPQAGGDKKLPPRRKSTYEDFVELFGSHGTV